MHHIITTILCFVSDISRVILTDEIKLALKTKKLSSY